MKKREFLTLVKVVREELKRSIDEAIQNYLEAARELDKEYYNTVREHVISLLKDPEMARKVMETAIEQGNVQPVIDNQWERGWVMDKKVTGVTVSPFIDLPDIPEYPKEKKKALFNQVQSLLKLKREYRNMLDAWKLNAIENRTYNMEPIPLVLYELLRPELRKLLVPGE